MKVFDNAYVLTGDDPRTREAFKSHTKGWKVIKVRVAHGLPEVLGSLSSYASLSQLDIQRYNNHVSLWKLLLESNMDSILIFEDSARTVSTTRVIEYKMTQLHHHLRKQGLKQPDILFLGKSHDDCGSYVEVMEGVYESFHPAGLHAYVINRRAAKKLLSILHNNLNLEETLAKYRERLNLRYMTFHPSLFYSKSEANEVIRIHADCKATLKEVTSTSDGMTLGILLFVIIVIILVVILIFLLKTNAK